MKQETFNKIATAAWVHKGGGAYISQQNRVMIDEAAAILGVCKRTVWGWRRKGLMPPATKIWRLVYWLRSDIEQLRAILITNDGGKSNV